MYLSLQDSLKVLGVRERMVSHDKEFCKELEIKILKVVQGSPRALSLEEIRSEINSRCNPKQSFYEVFHHTYQLVDKGDLILSTEGGHRTYVFRARS